MLDLIVPCFNPSAGWAHKLAESFKKLQALLPGIPIRVILVNDGSTQGVHTADIHYLQHLLPEFTYIAYEFNQGKGFAIRAGLKQSTYQFCLYTDIDFPYTEACMATVFRVLSEGKTDIVAGIRNKEYYTQTPFLRNKISKVLKALSKYLLKLPINDTQCGLKGFNQLGRQAFLETKTNRYLTDLEFIILASKKPDPLTLTPVLVKLKPEVIFSKMNIKILSQEGYSFLKLYARAILGL